MPLRPPDVTKPAGRRAPVKPDLQTCGQYRPVVHALQALQHAVEAVGRRLWALEYAFAERRYWGRRGAA